MTQTSWGLDEPDNLDNPNGPGRPNFEIHPNLVKLTLIEIWKNLV